jgi:hypothetical protein
MYAWTTGISCMFRFAGAASSATSTLKVKGTFLDAHRIQVQLCL